MRELDATIFVLLILVLLLGVFPLEFISHILGLILFFGLAIAVAEKAWPGHKKIFFIVLILVFLNLVPLYRFGGDCSGPGEPNSISIGWPTPVVSYFLGESEWGGCSGYTTDGPGHPIHKGDIRYSPESLKLNMGLVAIILPLALFRVSVGEKRQS